MTPVDKWGRAAITFFSATIVFLVGIVIIWNVQRFLREEQKSQVPRMGR